MFHTFLETPRSANILPHRSFSVTQFSVHATKGITLIEAVVSIALLSIALAGPMALAAHSIRASGDSRNEMIATHLAEEGLEAMHSVRDNYSADDNSAGKIGWLGNASGISLTWSASTDNVGVVGYNVYRGGVKIGTSQTTSYFDSSVSPNTTYSYTVSAYDAAGNESTPSGVINVTSPA